MSLHTIHTFTTLEISQKAYDEIRSLLEQYQYVHLINKDTIDMHGIGLVPKKPEKSFEEWCSEIGLNKDSNFDYNFYNSQDAALLLQMWASENGYETIVFTNSRGEWCVIEKAEWEEFTKEEE